MSEKSSENSSAPSDPIATMNTACERINYALDRIARVGWCQGRMRRHLNEGDHKNGWALIGTIEQVIAGPACLVGSLIADEEMEKLVTSDTLHQIYNGKGSLPGLDEAVSALGFKSRRHAWEWNDYQSSNGQTDVLDRLTAGKEKACS